MDISRCFKRKGNNYRCTHCSYEYVISRKEIIKTKKESLTHLFKGAVRNQEVQVITPKDAMEIASRGGGLVLDAGRFSPTDLKEIASRASGQGTI